MTFVLPRYGDHGDGGGPEWDDGRWDGEVDPGLRRAGNGFAELAVSPIHHLEGVPIPAIPDPTVHTVSVVVPARNEELNIAWVLDGLPACVDEVLVVDGFSTDRTVEVSREVRPDVVVLRQRGMGKGAAMRTGFERATGDFVVVLDSDGSMDPVEIDYYVHALADGYDFVKGSRFLPGAGSLDLTPVRSLGNRVLVHSVNVMWGVPYTDLCYGFLGFRRAVLPALALTSPGFEIETEMCIHAARAGLRIAEVPSVELARHYGASNLHPFSDGRRILRTLLRERLTPKRSRTVDALDRRGLVPPPRHQARTRSDRSPWVAAGPGQIGRRPPTTPTAGGIDGRKATTP